MPAHAAVIEQTQGEKQKGPAQHAPIRGALALAFHQVRKREHYRNAGDENEERKYQVVEREAFPLDVTELIPDEGSGVAQNVALAVGHFAKRPRDSITAKNPDEGEAA